MADRTLEQIEADFKLREFGVCVWCKVPFNFGDMFIDVTKGVCGSSQGYPCAFMQGEKERYHVSCFVTKDA